MVKMRVLVVDDEEGMLEVCRDTLRKLEDTEVVVESRSRRAAERLTSGSFDLLITDIKMPGLSGVELLRLAREHDPDLPVLMLTAFPAVETAVESMKLGASDYIIKPFIPDDLRATAQRLLEGRRLREENRLLARHVGQDYRFDDMLAESPAMQVVFDAINRVSETDAEVLIVGETGTGKELVARSIHKRSRQKGGRFVPVDCGAIPENLLESEFFGHERGAFTGAHAKSLGLLEFADGGTFFLDEIAELPLSLQVKLLRALQERKIRRVGGKEEIEVNVRILAATSRDLEVEVREERFREDLFYRINVIRIDLPPLRERGDDVRLLASHFVTWYAREFEKAVEGIDAEALDVLSSYSWPGNVRQLQNVLRRAIALTRNTKLTADDLPDDVVIEADKRAVARGGGYFELRARRLAAFEKDYLSSLLAAHAGDVTAAASAARLPRGTFYRLMKRHGLRSRSFRELAT